jgi:hypothetical protein
MSDFVDTDQLMRIIRSRLANALVGLSQIEEEMSAVQTPSLTVDTLDLIDTVRGQLGDSILDLGTLRDAVVNGDASTPTPDSLEEE